ncbi:unnamed protein product [Symbiodinium microadriaticum]|nr:unnamed protein product [Symbiodinium microadriaticum]
MNSSFGVRLVVLQVLTSLAKWSYPATAKSPVDVDAALKRAQESIPEDMIPVVTEVTLDSMILSPAFATGQAAIIALSNRPTPSALIRNAAAASKTFARMGFMSNPSPQFMAQLGNLPLPTVIGMMDGPEVDGQKNFQIMPYDPAVFGPINFHTLMAFIVNVDRQSTALRGGDSAESPGRVSPDKNGRDGPAILSEVSSADDWQKYCGDGFKGICAVGFMGAPAGVDPADAEAISVFQAAIDSMDLTSAYNFVWVDASCQTKLAEAFEVTGGATPALVVYSPLKNRFAKYVGSYAKDNMRSYLDSMAAGRVSTFPLSETPVYDSTVECLTAEALTSDTSSGDDFDADDFLAEMQKEEAERQAALKKSLEEERKAREADAKEKEKSKKKTKKKQKKSSKKKAEL